MEVPFLDFQKMPEGSKNQLIWQLIAPRDTNTRMVKARRAFPITDADFDKEVHNALRWNISAKESLNNICALEMHAAIAKVLDVSLQWFLFGVVLTDRDRHAETILEVHRDPHD